MRKISIILFFCMMCFLLSSCAKKTEYDPKQDVVDYLSKYNNEYVVEENHDSGSKSTSIFYYNNIKDYFAVTYNYDGGTDDIYVSNISLIWTWGKLEDAKITLSHRTYYFDYPNSEHNGELKFVVTSFHFSTDYPKIVVDSYDLSNTTKQSQSGINLEYKMLLLTLNNVMTFANNVVKTATNYRTQIQ